MPNLVRHRLLHVRGQALAPMVDQLTSGNALAGLRHWVEQQLPLVVTRRTPGLPPHLLSVGLPLPLQWGRLRLGFQLPCRDILAYTTFPALDEVVQAQGLSLQPLVEALRLLDLRAQVYGSYGWQTLSGLTYVHAGSDLDLLVHVNNDHQADLAATALLSCEGGPLRLDGELMFPDGSAVAWREWSAWRAGKTPQYLVKLLEGVHLASGFPALNTSTRPV